METVRLRKISRGHFSLNDFVKLKALAKNTVGCTTSFLLQEMSILLELYTQLDAKVEELDDLIEECVRGIDPPMAMLQAVDPFLQLNLQKSELSEIIVEKIFKTPRKYCEIDEFHI